MGAMSPRAPTVRTQADGNNAALKAIADLYGLLAEGFQYPDETTFSRLRSGAFAAEIGGILAGLQVHGRLARMAERLGEAVAETLERFSGLDLEACYNRLFVLLPIRERINVSLHGTAYTAAHEYMQSHQLAELSGLYASLGLQCSVGVRPDHISCELEFLRALTTREALANEAGQDDVARDCRAIAREFIQGHFAVWAPALCRALARRQPRFYGALGRLTRELSGWHLARLNRALGVEWKDTRNT